MSKAGGCVTPFPRKPLPSKSQPGIPQSSNLRYRITSRRQGPRSLSNFSAHEQNSGLLQQRVPGCAAGIAYQKKMLKAGASSPNGSAYTRQ